MGGPNEESDDAKATAGAVAGRAATVIDKKPKSASPEAAVDEETAQGKG